MGLTDYINTTWIWWTATLLYAVIILSTVVVVVSENRNPVKSLAWVTVLLVVPGLGLVLYIVFGRNIQSKRIISRRNRRRLKRIAADAPGDSFTQLRQSPKASQLARLATALCSTDYYEGNAATIFDNGTDKFRALLADIAAATKFINIEYYIIADDRIGTALARALEERARAGVKVRIIYDHVGSFKTKKRYFKSLRDAGVEAYPFFEVVFPPFGTRINWRNHRKLVIIDGRVGYIGGMNIADRYVNGGKFKCWRDTHMRITGPGVTALHYSFAIDWSFMGQPLIEEQLDIKPYTGPDNAGVQLITSGPTSEWSNVAMLMLKAIGNAKKRVFIQTPYFLPTESLLRSLQAAALSRVDVRVMLPRRSDSSILTYASYSYIMECLRAGIKIYLYDGGMLHSKTMMIDDNFSAIGSANIDFRSFEHNFEATMFIYSDDANARLRKQFLADQQLCQRVSPSVWRKRSKVQKAKESLTRLLSPIL